MIGNCVHLNKTHRNVLKREGALLRRRRAGRAGRAGLGLERGAEGSSRSRAMSLAKRGQGQGAGHGNWG